VNNIVVACWLMVPTVGFIYWQKTTTLFPRPVGTPNGSKKLGATDFEPFQIIGIVGYPHGIGITV